MCSCCQIEFIRFLWDHAAMAIEISFTGRTALVVGGGGGGIGSAVCHRLADAGADIVALSAVSDDLVRTSADVTERGRRVHTEVVDVTDLEALRLAIEAGAAALSPIDLVVNVVGGVTVEHWHRLADYPLESFDHLLTTNLRYALVSCQTVAAALIEAGRPGAMVNISSIASRGQPLLAGYGAAKAGLDSLTRSMAMEWGRHGIRVNNVAPGTVNTPRSGRSATDTEDPLAAAITLGRRGTPTDIGDGCVQLLDADEAHGALLLERLGEMLADTSIPLRDQHAAMCDALVRVWRPAPALGLPSGADHARALHALIPEHWERLGRPCGEAAIAHALHCCERREAAHDSEQAVLVHGDVHPWNALRRLDGPGVKLVDPDGLVAERELDLGVLMREHPESLLDGGDPFERARRLAALTATSADAIWEWGVAERVSTGLVALGIGLDEAGRAMLATADAIARNRR